MTILNIETSTSCCSAAITIEGKVVAHRENLSGANHASELPVFIEQLLHEAQEKGWHLDAVALSQGPGSYTGLRIGASIAKGICYGLNIPLIPIDTLQVLCASLQHKVEDGALLCPMLDARRMEVYTALYEQTENEGFKPLHHVQAMVIDEKAFAEELDTSDEVAVYVKLPNGFFIATPMGHYNPDWAIAFYEGKVKHIYFIAETKGSMSTLQLRGIDG